MVELTMDGKALKDAIKGIRRSATAFKDKVHVVAIQALLHAQEHNGVDHLNSLTKALTSVHRPEAFKAWVRDHTPLVWTSRTKKGKLIEGYTFKKDWSPEMWRIEAANEINYGDYSKEPDHDKIFGIDTVYGRLNNLALAIVRETPKAKAADRDRLTVMRDNVVSLIPEGERNERLNKALAA